MRLGRALMRLRGRARHSCAMGQRRTTRRPCGSADNTQDDALRSGIRSEHHSVSPSSLFIQRAVSALRMGRALRNQYSDTYARQTSPTSTASVCRTLGRLEEACFWAWDARAKSGGSVTELSVTDDCPNWTVMDAACSSTLENSQLIRSATKMKLKRFKLAIRALRRA